MTAMLIIALIASSFLCACGLFTAVLGDEELRPAVALLFLLETLVIVALALVL